MGIILILIFFSLSISFSPSCGFDPLDPHGNITIKWDLLQSISGTSDLRVSIFNFQQYRHVEAPGWKLSWGWTGNEVIWGMWGAEATEQGNCTLYRGSQTLPHNCEKNPVIVDLLPAAPYNLQSLNCCKGGVLTSITQDPSNYGATFMMNVGGEVSDFAMPENFTLGIPGYSCENKAVEVAPSRFPVDGGRRWTQALKTWNVTCIYSQFIASPTPKCCVSLSAFYNDTIVPCSRCSCLCPADVTAHCVRDGETPPLMLEQDQQDPNEEGKGRVRCTEHMCPVRIHWHVKESYREYWRVKVTVNNLNVMRNYSEWTLVVLHPNLRSLTQVFSFNYAPLNQHGDMINETGMFWGIPYYNDMLLQAGESGNVQTEMLLHKDPHFFTFSHGWAFPRRILFNGDECVMPLPDIYPTLPNGAYALLSPFPIIFPLLFFLLLL